MVVTSCLQAARRHGLDAHTSPCEDESTAESEGDIDEPDDSMDNDPILETPTHLGDPAERHKSKRDHALMGPPPVMWYGLRPVQPQRMQERNSIFAPDLVDRDSMDEEWGGRRTVNYLNLGPTGHSSSAGLHGLRHCPS